MATVFNGTPDLISPAATWPSNSGLDKNMAVGTKSPEVLLLVIALEGSGLDGRIE